MAIACDRNSMNATITIHKYVPTVTLAVWTFTDGKKHFSIGWRHTPPFFRRCGDHRTHTQVSEDFKTPIILPKQYYSSSYRSKEFELEIKSSILPALYSEKGKIVRAKGTLKFFYNNRSCLLDCMWPGTNKAGSCLLGACFKLLLLCGFILF